MPKRTVLALDGGCQLTFPKAGGELVFCNSEEEISRSVCMPLVKELRTLIDCCLGITSCG